MPRRGEVELEDVRTKWEEEIDEYRLKLLYSAARCGLRAREEQQKRERKQGGSRAARCWLRGGPSVRCLCTSIHSFNPTPSNRVPGWRTPLARDPS